MAGRVSSRFLPRASQCHLHPDGLALLVALSFPFNASTSTKYGNLKNAPVLSNVQNEEISRAQAQWNLDAAEWINSEQNGKQKSQNVCKWEKTQQKEFQKWVDPTKDSLLETDQIAFLQAIGFPLNAGGERDDMNTASSVRTNKKRPRRNSTGDALRRRPKRTLVPHELEQKRLRPQVVNRLTLFKLMEPHVGHGNGQGQPTTSTRVLLESSLSSFV